MAPLKSLSLRLVLLGLLSCTAFAEDATEIVGPFGTLNNTDTSFTIPSNKAQDLLNVDITPGGKSVKKRKGYATAFTLAISTNEVHGVYNFYETGGSDVSLFFNDTRISASIAGNSPSVLFSTGPLDATYQCVDSAGFAYCANSQRGSMVKTNGSSASLIQAVISTGTMLAVTPERLVSAGFSEAPSRIDFSKANDFTTWTVGGNPTDPINFTITAPGSRITHIVYAHGRIYWFKESSFGYILPGPTQSDWVVRTVNGFVGTIYNTSVFRDDILYFQGQDAHFYAWDGTNLVKLSRDIQTTINATQSRSLNAWTQTTAADWNAGVFDNNVYADTTTTSGVLATKFPDSFTTFRDGSNSSLLLYTAPLASPATAYVSNGYLNIGALTAAGVTSTVRGVLQNQDFTNGATYYVRIGSMEPDSGRSKSFYFIVQSTAPSSLSAQGQYAYIMVDSTAANCIEINSSQAKGNGATTVIFDGGGLTAFPTPLTLSLYMSASVVQVTVNGSSVLARANMVYTSNRAYTNWVVFSCTSTACVQLDEYSVVPQTFTFSSAVKNAPALASWDTLSGTTGSSGGSHSFSMRSSATTFLASAASPAWTSVTLGAIPTISTGAFFQVRDAFVTTSTNAMSMNDFTVNWAEGGASDKPYAIYHDNSLWWSVASGAGATTNNKVLKLDLLNQGWLIYDVPTNGMYVRNQSLYFGSPSAGTIFKFGDTTDDNGTAINSYWKSKDFFGNTPFVDKDYKRLSLAYLSVTNSTMTVTYTVNGSSSTAYTVPLLKGSVSFGKSNRNLPLGTVGSTFNVKFGNNASNQDWEVFGGQVDYAPKTWNPQ